MTHDRNRSNIFLRNEFCTVRISQRQRGVASHLSDMVTAVLDVSIASHHVPFVYRHPKHRNTAIKRTARTIAQPRTNACRRCQIESQRVPRNLLIARSLAPLNTVSLPLFPTLQCISRLTTAECSHHDVQLSLGEPHACSDEVVCIWWLMSDRDVKMFRLLALKTFIKVEVVRNYVQSVNYSYCIEASFKWWVFCNSLTCIC